jgi:cytochrome c-type biogenesis protein CcmH/NrfG
MNFRWRNANQPPPSPQPAPAATTAATVPVDTLIARADAMRDGRRWPDAAAAYQAVLDRAPQRAPIWVQLGHARKESGDLPAAEAAYRRAESSGDDRVAGPARDALADLVAGAAASGPADGALRGT